MGKQMEGDATERRTRAREAKRQGMSPSEAQVTNGASAQRRHEPRSADTETKQRSPKLGKRPSGDLP